MKFVPNAVTRPLFKSVMQLKKNSPNIMFTAGVVGVVGGTVLACRATLKLSEELPEMKAELEDVKEVYADSPDRNKNVTYVYGKNTGRVIRLYAPAVAVSAVSVGLLTGAHVTLTRRNAAATAAYAGLAKAYDDYRDRIRAEFGEEKELDIYHSAKIEKVKTKDGKAKKEKVVDPESWSPYARFFDMHNNNWQKDATINKLFIQCQQNYANQKLQARGYIFLNEVYEMLGMEHSREGQIVGWVLSEDGDNFIDFGLSLDYNRPFEDGWEPTVILDFNVDGVVWDKI